MTDIAEARKALIARICGGGGAAPVAERRSAFNNAELPAPLGVIVSKILNRPPEITDSDIAALRASNLSEDHIFEIAVCAAVGQAARRYDDAMAALEGTTGTE
jgi:hypothetical protein